MRFSHAITRPPGASFARGQTTASLGEPDPSLALYQHDAYCEALRLAGLTVITLPPEDDLPDAAFVEDTAVVVGQAAVLTRPGHPSRQGEVERIAPALARHLRLERIIEPGELDGGDVLHVPAGQAGRDRDHFIIGLSARTNPSGARQLGAALEERGCTWETVDVAQGLHLKSSVSLVAGHYVLAPPLAGHEAFRDLPSIILDENEAYAANCLEINQKLIIPDGYPSAKEQLASLGMPVVTVDVSEYRKMDGGLSCLSLRFLAQRPNN